MQNFPPDRTAALTRLAAFVPRAGRRYAERRNFDPGPGQHDAVSMLSPYLRHRVLTEEEVLRAVLGRHSVLAADKFVQEVFWRTYWKGWLERRPQVWLAYQTELRSTLDAVQTQSGMRRAWHDACMGKTGLDCFDAWAQELVQTGYLHNHARMWFASIWIFTLRLPWVLGADFFLRHLLDGDPASNTLSWRWVAGLQTRGKTYLARPDNIAQYTDGRFSPQPGTLATQAPPLEGPDHPAPRPAPHPVSFDPARPTAFILHEDDLSPAWLFDMGLKPLGTALLEGSAALSPLAMSPQALDFRHGVVADAAVRWSTRLGPTVDIPPDPRAIERWAMSLGAEQIVCAYAPVGPMADTLAAIDALPVVQMLRPHDAAAWPHARAGFFGFRKQIPDLLAAMALHRP